MPENNGKIREFWKWSFPRIEVIVSHMKVDVAHIKVIVSKNQISYESRQNSCETFSKQFRMFCMMYSNIFRAVFEHS